MIKYWWKCFVRNHFGIIFQKFLYDDFQFFNHGVIHPFRLYIVYRFVSMNKMRSAYWRVPGKQLELSRNSKFRSCRYLCRLIEYSIFFKLGLVIVDVWPVTSESVKSVRLAIMGRLAKTTLCNSSGGIACLVIVHCTLLYEGPSWRTLAFITAIQSDRRQTIDHDRSNF